MSKPIFWRDARMPHVELRRVADGRKVSYAPHSHTQWSLGAVTGGQCTFIYRDDRHPVSAGTLVMMNPNWVHCCNPIDNQPWAYLMLYVDRDWLSALRHEAGLLASPHWQDLASAVMTEDRWYQGYCRMTDTLLDPAMGLLEKQTAVSDYLSRLMHALAGQTHADLQTVPDVLQALKTYLDDDGTEALSLQALCARCGYSPGHLIRTFKQHFGLTPHAYLLNRPIQRGQQALKQGEPIAQVALNAGFSDQPHFQRTFKRLVAATPNEYRRPLAKH